MRRLAALCLLAAACNSDTELVDIPDPDPIPDPDTDTEVDTEVPEVPRFYLIEVPYGPAVSAQGHVLLWDWQTGGDVYVWTEAEGLEWVANTGAWFNSVHDISADGSTIIGSYGNYEQDEDTQAAIWSEATGWNKLGALPDTLDCPMQTAGWALTPDGQTAAGLAFSGCNGRAFRWTAEEGLVGFDSLGNGANRASAISDDGSLIVGFAQGDGGRTPAAWYADGSGELINSAGGGELYGANADGTKAVGQLGTKAIVWSPDSGHTFLGTLGAPGTTHAAGYALCGANDELIIGKDSLAGGTAFAWTEQTGMVQMRDWLASLGMEFPAGTVLSDATDCTRDKRMIIGHGGAGDRVGVWVAILPEHVFEDPPAE